VISADRADSLFLAGGGEMGALMRSFDWPRTPLGAENVVVGFAYNGSHFAGERFADAALVVSGVHLDLQ
jgi:hypothetical protein